MIIMVAEVVCHPGKGPDYEAAFLALQKVVRVKEPRTTFYESGKCREEPETYRAIEIFADEEAMQFHLDSEWLAEGFARMEPAIAELKVTIHDPLT